PVPHRRHRQPHSHAGRHGAAHGGCAGARSVCAARLRPCLNEPAMSLALAAIALAVVMHVTWNLLARRADPRSDFLWWGLAGHLVLIGPWSVWALVRGTQWSPGMVVALAVTAAANSVYFLSLRAAYRRAPVALVYPLARSSPLLIAL